ncbi:MAG: hypothetical protein J5858_14790 [Lentisphaeria bacterium]|nr:hypothetical protein [Lentisphaeria bacterium]
MKTAKCEAIMNRYLTGERSPAVKDHLEVCSRCRELADLICAITEKPAEETVPEELDRAVLSYAAARKRPADRSFNFSFLLRHAAIPLAAAFMVCICLAFAFRVPQAASGGALAQNRNSISQYELDSVDSELLLLSSRIQDTSVQLRNTAVYTGIYEQNGAMQ